jgi:pimeloyl-ACP methyl ester carboxylesterase
MIVAHGTLGPRLMLTRTSRGSGIITPNKDGVTVTIYEVGVSPKTIEINPQEWLSLVTTLSLNSPPIERSVHDVILDSRADDMLIYGPSDSGSGADCIKDISTNRKSYVAFCANALRNQIVESKEDDITLYSRLWRPVGRSRGLVIDVHGGPFESVSPLPSKYAAAWIARGYAVLATNYIGGSREFYHIAQPSPASRIDAMAREVVGAQKAVRAAYTDLGPDTILMGASFGGLVALTARRDIPNLKGVALASPICDSTEQTRWMKQDPEVGLMRDATRQILERDEDAQTCASALEFDEPLFVAYSLKDVQLGPYSTAALTDALAARKSRKAVQTLNLETHEPFALTPWKFVDAALAFLDHRN